jgi:hypothetical protein
MVSNTKSEKVLTTGWWRIEGRKKFPAVPDNEGGEGPFLCDEAVRLVAEWAWDLGEHTAESQQFRPTRCAVEGLLVDGDLPDWAEDDEIVTKAEEARNRVGEVYEAAWGRPPSDEECLELVAAAARTRENRWWL